MPAAKQVIPSGPQRPWHQRNKSNSGAVNRRMHARMHNRAKGSNIPQPVNAMWEMSDSQPNSPAMQPMIAPRTHVRSSGPLEQMARDGR